MVPDQNTKPFDPTHAPMHRRLLGARVIALNILILIGLLYCIDLFDEFTKQNDSPKWIVKVGSGIFALELLAIAAGSLWALKDTIIHLLPDGKIKHALLKERGDTTNSVSPQKSAEDFEKDGHKIAYLPIYLAAWIVGIGLVLLLIFGGFALVVSGIGALFGSMPFWAAIIIVLLVMNLYKK